MRKQLMIIVVAICIGVPGTIFAEDEISLSEIEQRVESALQNGGGEVGSGNEDVKIVYNNGKKLADHLKEIHPQHSITVIEIPKLTCFPEADCHEKISECRVHHAYGKDIHYPQSNYISYGFNHYFGWFATRRRVVRVCVAYNGKLNRISTLEKNTETTRTYDPDESGKKWAEHSCAYLRERFLAGSKVCK